MFAVINVEIQTKRCFHGEIYPKCADRMANSVDPDHEQSDLGLHCLHRPASTKT